MIIAKVLRYKWVCTSGLSPLLFVIVMEAISREFTVALPWEVLYADDLAVIAETAVMWPNKNNKTIQ